MTSVVLLSIIITLAVMCIWLLVRARRAEAGRRAAEKEAELQFEMWCKTAAQRDHLKEVVRWLHLGEDARARRNAS